MNILQKIAKAVKIFLIVFIAALVLFAAILAISHAIKLSDEEKALAPTGNMFDVNGHQMHVYQQGDEDSENTIIIMSDWGIADGTIAYMPLINLLAEDNRVAFAERSGYGYSEVSEASRDIDTVLDETRAALTAAGETAPYVLMPHTAAGLEAIYWAQKYPDEVKAIVGLDIGTPKMYESIEEPGWLNTMMYLITRIGAHRLFGSYIYTANTYGNFTWDEFENMKALQIKCYYDKDMLNEILSINANAKVSTALPTPIDTPLLAFAANPYLEDFRSRDKATIKELEDVDDPDYLAAHYNDDYKTYFMQYNTYEIIEVPSDNTVYANQPELIAENTNRFLSLLD